MFVVPPVMSSKVTEIPLKSVSKNEILMSVPSSAVTTPRVSTAIVYCEANFGDIDGKTANGLIRRSEKYQIIFGYR